MTYEKRKATELRNIMDEFQVTLEKAEEIYTERRRKGGHIAGKKNRGKQTGFAIDPKRASESGKKGMMRRWGK